MAILNRSNKQSANAAAQSTKGEILISVSNPD